MDLTRRMMLGLVAGSGLSGCSWLGFGDDEDAQPPEEGAEGFAARGREPVQNVQAIEVGRTASGIAIAAFGTAPGLGYARPTLVPRREGKPAPDGFLEYDLMAIPPDPDRNLPQGAPSARQVRADVLVDARALAEVRGVRVFALEGGRQLSF